MSGTRPGGGLRTGGLKTAMMDCTLPVELKWLDNDCCSGTLEFPSVLMAMRGRFFEAALSVPLNILVDISVRCGSTDTDWRAVLRFVEGKLSGWHWRLSGMLPAEALGNGC